MLDLVTELPKPEWLQQFLKFFILINFDGKYGLKAIYILDIFRNYVLYFWFTCTWIIQCLFLFLIIDVIGWVDEEICKDKWHVLLLNMFSPKLKNKMLCYQEKIYSLHIETVHWCFLNGYHSCKSEHYATTQLHSSMKYDNKKKYLWSGECVRNCYQWQYSCKHPLFNRVPLNELLKSDFDTQYRLLVKKKEEKKKKSSTSQVVIYPTVYLVKFYNNCKTQLIMIYTKNVL